MTRAADTMTEASRFATEAARMPLEFSATLKAMYVRLDPDDHDAVRCLILQVDHVMRDLESLSRSLSECSSQLSRVAEVENESPGTITID